MRIIGAAMAEGSIRRRVHKLLEKSESSGGRGIDWFIQAMIIVSVVSFTIETLPDLPAATRRTLDWLEVICVAVFTIEYAARVWSSPDRARFIFSFYGLIDLAAIFPFYANLAVDFRSIRILRLFRLLRLFKLLRYSEALNRFYRAFMYAREELILFSVATMALMFLSSVGIYYFEHSAQPEHFKSVPHSMWWAVATLTTVGYGDIFPVTLGGRIFTFIILMLGLGVVSLPAGVFASALTKVRRSDDDRLENAIDKQPDIQQ